jgi:hypothetical protein
MIESPEIKKKQSKAEELESENGKVKENIVKKKPISNNIFSNMKNI